MENAGALAVLLAFCLSLYAVVASLVGHWKRRPLLALSGERAVYGVWLLITAASAILVSALLKGDFRLFYVWSSSDRSMPTIYKFAAWWGGQAGSLLFWCWLLASYAGVVVWRSRRRFRNMMPYVVAVIMTTLSFFLMLITFVVSPFEVLMQGRGIVDLGDGRGLNPLLQYWTMVIHPPFLYLGFVGFVVPFAFAFASLVTRQPGEEWIATTRKWSLVTWLFQTTGILLGAGWAYAVLGWGGYWGWDPVENASLLPWLTSTAFLHSVMMQEKKGMMKVWNMVLVSATFFLCIFGTFLTRSGVLGSVHAFAQSPIGIYFAIFLPAGIALTAWLIVSRLDYLKSEAQLESVLSRESAFLFNNLILVASCFSILWGTLFPLISEAVTGEKVSVDAPFYNKINIPIGLFLLFLTGVGPLIAWRRSSLESLKKAFLWPTVGAAALVVVLILVGIRHPYALMSFGLCLFVTLTILSEFYKGSRAIQSRTGMSFLRSMVELTHRNTRRYGGYLVHLGIVSLFIGFTGAAFNKEAVVEVAPGQPFRIGRYELKLRETRDGETPAYVYRHAVIDVYQGGQLVRTLQPEARFYRASEQRTSEVAIWRRLNEDLYLNFASVSADGKAVIQAYVFPLVSWIWIGYWIILGGTLICLIPSKVRREYVRTQVMGVTQAHVPAEK
jgi:cytochrome c-type biogenesis protein CcmF